MGKLALVLASLVASIAFGYLFGIFKFSVLPISLAVLFVLYYFMVQREEKSKKVVPSDSL